ncbi:MAG: cold-shock protein [Elusimicrobiota bacterium]
MKGTVKFFNDRKNFGFIEPEDGSDDHFVHVSDIEFGSLSEGDQVEFESVDGEKGLKAVSVNKL